MNTQFDKIGKIYERLPILNRDQMIASRTKRNSLKNRVIDLIIAADDKYPFDEKTDPDEVLKVIDTLKRKRNKTEEDMVGILILGTLHNVISMAKALDIFSDNDFSFENAAPSVPVYTYNETIVIEKKKKGTKSFTYEMFYSGVTAKTEQKIIDVFIDCSWKMGLYVFSYELKQSTVKKKRCLTISFDSGKYFKLPEEDQSINKYGFWDDNLGSDYIQNNIYSRLSDKEQFYGLIWGCCDENELPEACFLANAKKYKVIWGKRAYLELDSKK